ncbi:MAG: hypothetical protein ACRC2P_04375 [Eubacterium aggregans]
MTQYYTLVKPGCSTKAYLACHCVTEFYSKTLKFNIKLYINFNIKLANKHILMHTENKYQNKNGGKSVSELNALEMLDGLFGEKNIKQEFKEIPTVLLILNTTQKKRSLYLEKLKESIQQYGNYRISQLPLILIRMDVMKF